MLSKITEKFRGDRKYFAIVFFILILIFIAGVVGPYLIEERSDNWQTFLSEKTTEIEDQTIESFSLRESGLLKTASHLRNDLKDVLKLPANSYRQLIELINKDKFENYSVEILAPNGKLIAWNNSIAVEQEKIFPLELPYGQTYFHNDALVTYLSVTDTLHIGADVFYYIVSKPIEFNFTLQNQYFKQTSFDKDLEDEFLTEFIVEYNPLAKYPKDGRLYTFDLLNKDGSKIGIVSFFKPSLNISIASLRDLIAKIQTAFVILLLIVLVFGFRSDFKMIDSRAIRFSIILFYLIVVRIVLYALDFPSNFLEGPLVDPANFASSFGWGIVKSPADFLLTSILAVIATGIFFSYVKDYFLTRSRVKHKVLYTLFAIPWIFLFPWTIRGLSAVIKSVIFDSSIRYFKEPNIIPNLVTIVMNINILAIGISVLLVLIAYCLIIGKFTGLLRTTSGYKNILVFYLLLTGFTSLFFALQREQLISFFLIIIIVTVTVLLTANLIIRKNYAVQQIILTTLSASIITIALLNYFNVELEVRSLRTTALEINRANENLLHFLIDETIRDTKNNEMVSAIGSKSNLNYDAISFLIWSRSPLQRESLNSAVAIYNRNENLLGYFEVGMNEFNKITDSVNLRKIDDLTIEEVNIDGENIIAGILPIKSNEIITGYLLVSVNFEIETLGAQSYPDFLESDRSILNNVIDIKQLKIFEFIDNDVVKYYGDLYPSREQTKEIMSANFSEYNDSWTKINFGGENYITYVIQEAVFDSTKTLAISVEDKAFSWNLFNFFKLFILHSIFILLLFIILFFLKIRRINYSFKSKLLLAFLVISIIPVIILAIYNRNLVNEREEAAVFNELNKRINYLENHIRVQKEKHPERDLITAFENAGVELGISFSVFDGTDLIYTSRDKYYNSGLFDKKLNSEAHYHLNYLSYREYQTKENLMDFIYDSYYKKIIIDGEDLVFGVNDAFNKVRVTYSTVQVDVFLFGVYSFAVLIIIIISTIFANQISSPVRRLTKATEAVGQGDLNVRIKHSELGEMKDLLDGFNSMTTRLKHNQAELAELEREAAWKEMAKQVAHEIKNPLTPMKLAIQQLIISYKDKSPKFDNLFDRVSGTILKQIETLNHIASEFSNFAKMPNIKVEKVNLVDSIKEAVNLFVDENIKIKIEADEKEIIIESDDGQLRRMLINMIRNSLQANSTEVHISSKALEDTAELIVKDNGDGIPEEQKDKIFNPDFTTKQQGMGLGLSLVKRFLENTGGTIKLIESSPDGTTFLIIFPLVTQA